MYRVARFYKVSEAQFEEGWQDTFGQAADAGVYEKLKLPERATAGSAGVLLSCNRYLNPSPLRG